jgi:hypothetical protein
MARPLVLEKQRAFVLPVVSIILTAASVPIGGFLSFWAYSLPAPLLLPAPYTGWTVFIAAAILWCLGLVSAVASIVRKRSSISGLALLLALLAPILIIAVAAAVLLIGLNDHAFSF